jgi:hypothetical protein
MSNAQGYGYNPPVPVVLNQIHLPVEVGTLAGAAVVINMAYGFGPIPVSVTMTADYVVLAPDGFPDRPNFTGTAIRQASTMLVQSGSVFVTFKPEADALVTLGAATYN